MTVKHILVPVSHSDHTAANVAAAFAVAKAFGCHVAGLHVRPDPRAAIPYIGEGMTADVIQELCDAAERDGLEKSNQAQAIFHRLREAASVPLSDGGRHDTASADWVEAVGDQAQIIASRGRVADLSVIRRPGDGAKAGAAGMLEGILFRSGRPALVVPANVDFRFPKTLAVAWNGSAESSRAVAFAMPFLVMAERVHIITAGELRGDCPSAEALADYLAWHHVAAVAVEANGSGDSVGAKLLGEARELGAELMVMGAYTHNRWREMILGGVTRFMLANSDVPLLLVH